MDGMWNTLSAGQQKFIKIWVTGIVVIYTVLIAVAVHAIETEKRASDRNHLLRMDPVKAEPGLTQPDPLPATGNFVNVAAGAYVDNVDTF